MGTGALPLKKSNRGGQSVRHVLLVERAQSCYYTFTVLRVFMLWRLSIKGSSILCKEHRSACCKAGTILLGTMSTTVLLAA